MGLKPGECPAQIGEFPVPFFGDRVLIRLPVGVNEDNFVEFTPGVFARSTGAIESGNCREGRPGATIYFIAMTVLSEQPRPDRPLASIRDDTLDAFGYPHGRVLVEQDDDAAKPTSMWVYEIPTDQDRGKPDPAKILVAMKVVHGQTFAIVFEVHPNAWSVIVDTLVASAQHMSVLSP